MTAPFEVTLDVDTVERTLRFASNVDHYKTSVAVTPKEGAKYALVYKCGECAENCDWRELGRSSKLPPELPFRSERKRKTDCVKFYKLWISGGIYFFYIVCVPCTRFIFRMTITSWKVRHCTQRGRHRRTALWVPKLKEPTL